MFDLSLQVLKGDTCHSHSSTPFDNQIASFHCTHLSKKFQIFTAVHNHLILVRSKGNDSDFKP